MSTNFLDDLLKEMQSMLAALVLVIEQRNATEANLENTAFVNRFSFGVLAVAGILFIFNLVMCAMWYVEKCRKEKTPADGDAQFNPNDEAIDIEAAENEQDGL